ncbi:hypothetical protein NDU88_009231 [Pleurodeles waltl]|uniref:Uncharacterized protein n=1 Tax=Pleurodeles waltl TaxID=8319 RepID=A0AAV7QR33_PLEWA|nr:hypothetical protein NDU88_009231 [Pleurodeles waltl]
MGLACGRLPADRWLPRDHAETAVGSPGAARSSCETLGASPPAAALHLGVAFRDPRAARKAGPCSALLASGPGPTEGPEMGAVDP